MTKLRWELLARDNDNSDIVTWRAKVPGGWLVSVWGAKATADGTVAPDYPGGANWGGGVAFVPDSKHEWEVAIDSDVGGSGDSKPRRREATEPKTTGRRDGLRQAIETHKTGRRHG